MRCNNCKMEHIRSMQPTTLIPLMSCIAVSLVEANLDFQKTGWLDRVVAYHKNRFFEDVKKYPTVQIQATIQRAPPGFVDSEGWDESSVLRLIDLMRESNASRPAFMALRRAFYPSRRLNVGVRESFKLFPSLSKNIRNNFYYSDYENYKDKDESIDEPTDNKFGEEKIPDDDDIIYVSNPVEARLPSAGITVRLMKEILEARALEAKKMPTTSKPTISWLKDKRNETTSSSTPIEDKTTNSGKETEQATDNGTATVSGQETKKSNDNAEKTTGSQPSDGATTVAGAPETKAE